MYIVLKLLTLWTKLFYGYGCKYVNFYVWNVVVCACVHAYTCTHTCMFTCYICEDSSLLRCHMSVFVINTHSFPFMLIIS